MANPAPEPNRSVTFVVVDPTDPRAQWALASYFAELDERFPDGFDPGDAATADVASYRPPEGTFLLVEVDGVPSGCGALQTIGPGVGEVKRMWIADHARGLGLGRRLLEALEGHARSLGHQAVRLDTNGTLDAALALYRRSGYVEIERYCENPYAEHWFEKRWG